MTPIPITSALAAVSAVALVALSVPVTMRRLAVGVLVGTGTDDVLFRRIRAQGNFVEYVPLSLLALGIVEAGGAPSWLMLVLAASLSAGRLLHAVGMWRDSGPLRGFETLATYATLVIAAVRIGMAVARG